MFAARLVVTAADGHRLKAASGAATGYGTSMIGCDAEVEGERPPHVDQTPDGRLGAALLFFGRNVRWLSKAVRNRAGQYLMTCPITAVFDGLPAARRQAIHAAAGRGAFMLSAGEYEGKPGDVIEIPFDQLVHPPTHSSNIP